MAHILGQSDSLYVTNLLYMKLQLCALISNHGLTLIHFPGFGQSFWHSDVSVILLKNKEDGQLLNP